MASKLRTPAVSALSRAGSAMPLTCARSIRAQPGTPMRQPRITRARQSFRRVVAVSTKPQPHHDREAKLVELHEHLVASVETLVTGDEWKRALEFAARFRTRSFNNTLLIWWQHEAAYRQGRVPDPMPTYVAGFKQWQTLGRRVIAGQRGYMIFAPLTARFATSSPMDADSWRRLDRNERPRAGEIVRPRMVGVRPAYVWDVSQTDGRPLPELPAPQPAPRRGTAGTLGWARRDRSRRGLQPVDGDGCRGAARRERRH